MSTGADCRFIEVTPGHYVYELQRYPYGQSEEYDRFGPFRSFSVAVNHLSDNHANPGGWMTRTLPEGQHVHEMTTRKGAYVQEGVVVTLNIASLGNEPTKEAILARLASGALTPDHLLIKPRTIWKDDVVVRSCEACGKDDIR